jgi:hypothetical protein
MRRTKVRAKRVFFHLHACEDLSTDVTIQEKIGRTTRKRRRQSVRIEPMTMKEFTNEFALTKENMIVMMNQRKISSTAARGGKGTPVRGDDR